MARLRNDVFVKRPITHRGTCQSLRARRQDSTQQPGAEALEIDRISSPDSSGESPNALDRVHGTLPGKVVARPVPAPEDT